MKRGLALGMIACLVVMHAPASAAAPILPKWCWSMQGGALKGTFTTTGTTPGDGTAPAGTYNLTDASVYESAFPDIEVGSIADGTYRFGTQPQFQIIWDGTSPTGFYRDSGNLTNGFGIYNGASGSGAFLSFDVGYQRAATTNAFGGTQIFQSNTTPSVTPAPASGLCAGQAPSSGADAGSTPADILEQYGRLTAQDTCRETYGPSWAMWMHGETGGWVCTRTLYYDNSTRSWQVR